MLPVPALLRFRARGDSPHLLQDLLQFLQEFLPGWTALLLLCKAELGLEDVRDDQGYVVYELQRIDRAPGMMLNVLENLVLFDAAETKKVSRTRASHFLDNSLTCTTSSLTPSFWQPHAG